ncbi:C-C motif chemokine 20-like [Alligator sinensis]|uniref:C-C motif chemokine n=1 Tax=Alligator sinensis TaxID=38654 RepID=A0A1U7RV15_ALLSI|nr:C-C motif chemokine 20-like [Alligator sinensis]
MASFNSKTLVLYFLVGLLFVFWTAEAQSNQDCCLSYTRAALPPWVISGYTEQSSNEVCDINAIIFHTKSGIRACTNPKAKWVKKQLLFLSKRLKKMSNQDGF